MTKKNVRRPKTFRAVTPNAGLEMKYRRKLEALIDEMQRSIEWFVRAAYRQNEPELLLIAQDESPAASLQRVSAALRRRWTKRFNEAAPELSRYFAKAVSKRVDGQLDGILKKAGIAVEFKTTAEVNDVLQATVAANVQLIKSIPAKQLDAVQGAVMRSVQTGRDLKSLTDELQESFGVTRRRAKFIALDQNNKATSAMSRVRSLALGLDEGTWFHSGGGKHPRPTHVANSGKVFSLKKGWWDPAIRKWIFPGEEPGCRCGYRAVIPGLAA